MLKNAIFIKRRDDHTLDLLAELAEKHPAAAIIMLRGSAHWRLGTWLQSSFQDAPPTGREIWDWTIARAIRSLERGRQQLQQLSERDFAIEQLIDQIAPLYWQHSDVSLPVAESWLAGTLREVETRVLIEAFEKGARKVHDQNLTTLQTLYERGALQEAGAPKPVWTTLPEFLRIQLAQTVTALTVDVLYEDFFLVPATRQLGTEMVVWCLIQEMTAEQIAEFTVLISEESEKPSAVKYEPGNTGVFSDIWEMNLADTRKQLIAQARELLPANSLLLHNTPKYLDQICKDMRKLLLNPQVFPVNVSSEKGADQDIEDATLLAVSV